MNIKRICSIAALAALLCCGYVNWTSGQTSATFAVRPVQQLYLELDFDDPDITTGVVIGQVPANSFVHSVTYSIRTPFNASGNNLLAIGIAAGSNVWAINEDLTQAAGTYSDTISRAVSQNQQLITVDRTIHATCSFPTGTPTAGKVQIAVTFGPA